MLKSIFVSGLKSLNNFKLELKPGLNVLVGPNGSGKSNILMAFELVSNLRNLDFLNSVGFLGQIELFKLFDMRKKDKKINMVLEGETDVAMSVNGSEQKGMNLAYEFGFELEYNMESDKKMYFSKQFLNLSLIDSNINEKKELSIEFKNNIITINKLNEVFIDKNIIGDLISYYGHRIGILNQRSIVDELSLGFQPLEKVLLDLASAKVYNIDPNAVRFNMEERRSPIVEHNGRGLLSALLKICENANRNEKLVYGQNGSNVNYEDAYGTIVSYMQEVLPDTTGLCIDYNWEKDRISGALKFNDDIDLPIDLLSDGSLKWLALITALLATENIFILEEPENYLHPVMQQQITELMMETVYSKNDVRLFSTHSETILNKLSPEDIILTYCQNGQTFVNRIKNPKKLNESIQNTGFGMGWYFVSGVLD